MKNVTMQNCNRRHSKYMYTLFFFKFSAKTRIDISCVRLLGGCLCEMSSLIFPEEKNGMPYAAVTIGALRVNMYTL